MRLRRNSLQTKILRNIEALFKCHLSWILDLLFVCCLLHSIIACFNFFFDLFLNYLRDFTVVFSKTLFLAYLGVLFRDLIYLHDALPTYVGPQKRLINMAKVENTSLLDGEHFSHIILVSAN
jgi:hypothetical protein